MQERGDPSVLTYGAIQLIPATHTVLLDGKPVHLAKMEYRLLGYLLQHPGETLPRQDLLLAVWGMEEIGMRTLDIHICALRRKLSLGRNLETVMKVGYKLRSQEKERSE